MEIPQGSSDGDGKADAERQSSDWMFSLFNEESLRQIYTLRLAYMHLYRQYMDLDDEYHKLRNTLGEM